ncbi:MAG TPA: hypothetical protein VGF52_00960 [Tepidisphaeraceae bacterium]
MRQIATLSLLSTLMLFSLAMHLADPLEAQWNVKVIDPSGTGRPFDDMLTFKNGVFTSQALLKKGFKPGQFDEDLTRFGPATFTAILKSDSDGTAKWTGTVAATSISGDLVWTKKDGAVLNYSYSGQRSDQ